MLLIEQGRKGGEATGNIRKKEENLSVWKPRLKFQQTHLPSSFSSLAAGFLETFTAIVVAKSTSSTWK